MKTKVFIVIVLITVLCFAACSIKEFQKVEVCNDESMLVDFYEENGVVHYICKIKLCNNTSQSQVVKIRGTSQEDVENGLLSSPYLIGYSTDQSDTFIIDANSNCIAVVDFRGVYAGVFIKKDRLIPDVIEIEVLGGQGDGLREPD